MFDKLVQIGSKIPWETMDHDCTCHAYRQEEPTGHLRMLVPHPPDENYIVTCLPEREEGGLRCLCQSEDEIRKTPAWIDDVCVVDPGIAEQIFSRKKKQQITVPDLSSGLAKKQENVDIYELEGFAVNTLPICVVDGQTCMHNGRFWEILSKTEFSTRLREYFRKYKVDRYLTMREYTDIYNLVLINQSVQRDKFVTPEHSLNLMDGRLDLTNMQVYPHDREDGYFNCLPLYSDDILNPVYGPTFEQFMEDNPLIRKQILEMIGVALTGRQVKAFYVLVGATNSGKSQLIRFLLELLEHKNVMSFSAPSELNRQFALANAKNKKSNDMF